MPQRESPRGSTTQPKGETRIRNRLPALVVANVDPGLRLLLKRTLSAAGYEVALVATVQDLVTKVSADQPEGILLSTSFAGDQTPALARSLKRRSSAFMIALVEEGSTTVLEREADDIASTPFRDDELVLKVQNAHRRARMRQSKPLAAVHDGLVIDLSLRQVSVDGRRVSLSRQEFEVLRTLAEHGGMVVGYGQFFSEAWRDAGSRALNRLRRVIHALRIKLGRDDQGRSFIITDNRTGYALRNEKDAQA